MAKDESRSQHVSCVYPILDHKAPNTWNSTGFVRTGFFVMDFHLLEYLILATFEESFWSRRSTFCFYFFCFFITGLFFLAFDQDHGFFLLREACSVGS